jgi:hypothetical protein
MSIRTQFNEFFYARNWTQFIVFFQQITVLITTSTKFDYSNSERNVENPGCRFSVVSIRRLTHLRLSILELVGPEIFGSGLEPSWNRAPRTLLIGCSFKNAAQNQYNLKLREQWFKNNNEIVISVCTSR